MAERPGIILYFDTWEPIMKFLPPAEFGAVVAAAIKYGHYGEVPELDGSMAFAWETARPGLDRDGNRYAEKQIQTQYAGYCSAEARAGREPLSRSEWESRQRLLTGVDERQPTIKTTPTTTPTSESTSDSKAKQKQIQQEQQLEGEGQGDPRGEEGGTAPPLVFRDGRYVKIIDGHECKADQQEIEAYTQVRKREQIRKMGW